MSAGGGPLFSLMGLFALLTTGSPGNIRRSNSCLYYTDLALSPSLVLSLVIALAL